MATPWDNDTYPLSDKTRFVYLGKNAVDFMADGTVRNRTLSNISGVKLMVVIDPLDESTSGGLETLLMSIQATEYTITHNGTTYIGYIDTGSVRKRVTNGVLHWWTFTFIGKIQ